MQKQILGHDIVGSSVNRARSLFRYLRDPHNAFVDVEGPTGAEIKRLTKDWARERKADGLPPRSSFDPIDYSTLMPVMLLSAIDYDLNGRLRDARAIVIGENFMRDFEVQPHEKSLSGLEGAIADRWKTACAQIVERKEPITVTTHIVSPTNSPVMVELTFLPFAGEKMDRVDYILCVYGRLK